MIKFINSCSKEPYKTLKDRYNEAKNAGQKKIEAICISSYDINKKEVDSRFVNLKYVDNEKFIFFSNYNSPKSYSFQSHEQISALIYWSSIDVQIRMKAQIKKTPSSFNRAYFLDRSPNKNALAISSNQSENIESYEDVILNYNNAKKSKDLSICPDYWGGFEFKPYYFEFWIGHVSRLNKRESYSLKESEWIHNFLQP